MLLPYSHLPLRDVHKERGDFKLLLLPFTAHVKLPEEYRRRYGFQVHIDEVEKSIRLCGRLDFLFPFSRMLMREVGIPTSGST